MAAGRHSTLGVKTLISALERRGLDPAPVLARHGLQREQVLPSLVGVPPLVEMELYHSVSRQLGDPAFAVHAGAALTLDDYGLYGHLMASMATVRDAVFAAMRFNIVVNDRRTGRFTESGVGRYELHPVNPLLWSPAMAELRLRAAMDIPLNIGGTPMRVLEVHHTHAAPEHAAELERSYGAKVKFDQPVDALIFDPEILDRPTLAPNPGLALSLVEAIRFSLTPPSTQSWAGQVERLALAALESQESPSLVAIAKKLRIPERTLRLKLAQEDTTFGTILENLRKAIAMARLHKPGMTVEQLAELLGYTDPRQFYRRFREWTGSTPTQWFAGSRAAQDRPSAGVSANGHGGAANS